MYFYGFDIILYICILYIYYNTYTYIYIYTLKKILDYSTEMEWSDRPDVSEPRISRFAGTFPERKTLQRALAGASATEA